MPIATGLDGVPAHVTDHIEATVLELADGMYDLQKSIHEHPQIAFTETYAHDVSTAYMEKQGWKVTRHAYGLETGWEATYEVGTGGPIIGYNSEMDSLPNLGHACGHNLICMGGIAASVSTARALEKFGIPGKVVLLGTPAEEVYGGKCYMLQRGAYKGMEGCLMLHPYIKGYGTRIHLTPCIAAFSINYTGVSAHAGDKPEDGVNALDAAVTAYTSIAMMRQHLPSTHKVTIVIKGSEKFISNTVPNRSSIWVGVRAPSGKEVTLAIDKILNCLKAGALASGCTYEISREHMYMDMQQSESFCDYYTQVTETKWGQDGYKVDRLPITAGTDMGNVSYHMPALHALFYLPSAKAGDYPHSETFAQCTHTREASDMTLKHAAAIATVGIRMIVDRPWAQRVKDDWKANMEALDGHKVRARVEQVFESYPLSKDVDKMVCACH